ncbi:unnamed protein product [Oppiella nova]|uniref:Uncharacterized protein n=1 Tax=Oppiella nova TaxID=334625 RepID=A0A7R9M3Q6_9ACAR|nr:unnamed protein product [Oppiella nova]CAG2170107.1 unnamed protein product [Oppiella nova]
MSEERDNKNDCENRLMDDSHKESAKNYGTDGTNVGSDVASDVETKAHEEVSQTNDGHKRDSMFYRIRHMNATEPHINFIDRVVSIIFDTSEVLSLYS